MLAISSLGAGGAERVLALLAGAFVARGHDVSLVTLAHSDCDFFPVDARVRRIGLGLQGDSPNIVRGVWANVRRLHALRRIVTRVQPQVVLSFLTSMNVLAILACSRLPVRVIVSERVDPAAHREDRIWVGLRWLLYRRADAIVVQAERIAEWFRMRAANKARVIVIPNPVAPMAADVEASADYRRPFLLAAGRLARQKGFDLLIHAFARVVARTPDLQLVIVGEGPEEEHLRDLAGQLGLDARVSFPGQVRELRALMKAAVAFILPSRYEGFPNVLLEALAAGTPCVAADCPGATRTILANGTYGLLVAPEDPVSLADAINLIVTNCELRKQFVKVGAAAVERYRLDRVVVEWEQVLEGRRQPSAAGH